MTTRRVGTAALVAFAFALGVAAGRSAPAPAPLRAGVAPAGEGAYEKMLHVGIVVRDLDAAVKACEALGFTDIRVLPPNAGVDRHYHGKPIDVTIRQAFIHGTTPMIELIEAPADVPSPWSDFLKDQGEGIHHVAYRVPDAPAELERWKALGMKELARGKWAEGDAHWGTFHYVRGEGGGPIVEFISRVPREKETPR
jgi:catechol 2,3-dioxygenase-like lactoylglutathione lyase family enzyme